MANKITFPSKETFNAKNDRAKFLAEVEGKQILCAITYQALSDKFKADFARPLDAFKANRHLIEEIAEKLIREGRFENDGSILIKYSDMK